MHNKRMVSLVMAVCGVVLSAPSYALDLSLSDAVERVSNESHDLKKANANVEKAQSQLDAVNANRWFKLDGTVAYSNTVNVEDPTKPRTIEIPGEILGEFNEKFKGGLSFEFPDNMFTASVNLTQPIYTFGKIGNAGKGVKSAIKMAE
ncbi:MAG: TolC family protein, partial [Alphaproteobacteria bacterium]